MAKQQTETQPRPQIVQLQPSRLPIVGSIAREFDVTPDQWRVLVDQIFPAAKTVEAIGMALAYCRARNLDIFKRPVHIVPMWSSALKRMVETVWPGIAEIRTTAARTGEYAGIDAVVFGPMVKKTFKGMVDNYVNGTQEGQREEKITVEFPEWASVVVYRMVQGTRCPFHAIVYWEEAYASTGKTDLPNAMWQKRPRGQIGKCVEAAALRQGFPEEIGNTLTADEMEGRTIDAVPNGAAAITARQLPPEPPEEPAGTTTATKAPEPPHGEDGGKGGASAPASEPTAEDILADLEELLSHAADAEAVEKAFDDFDVPGNLSGNDDALARAFAIKRAALGDEVQDEGDDLTPPDEPTPRDPDTSDMFPGDLPR